MPQPYKDMDIKQYILTMCRTEEQVQRVNIELAEYEKRGLLMLLKQMKYIIDTLRENNIVWGVGRGSSVASYTLFLMGVHRIDSIKYNIPLNEFFKGV
jgi:DNA polymerase III alpha subunit